ncbi:MAG: [acyl-carrier-protein] S-malonyltransferase, partial [Proteobacteria bacterium]|nr:[acyl-carrier-protein] S-malonyltransferase [Pseudomonadota bacterium]
MSTAPQTIALFPGQGSQKVGMGKDLAERSEIARDLFSRADKALGFPLSAICFDGPAERLTSTEIAQPAILTVSVICFEMARAALGNKLSVCTAAGHSLGEYSALVAAGALRFEDAVVLVNKRGRYMQSAVPAGVGKMIAVLGKEVRELESAIAQVGSGVVDIANINAPGQIVVSGKREAVDAFMAELGNAKVIELQVSAPFHCALMEPAATELARDLDEVEILPVNFPVISNVTANPVKTPAEIRDALKRQVCGRVRWV